jgi:hypothetical protein
MLADFIPDHQKIVHKGSERRAIQDLNELIERLPLGDWPKDPEAWKLELDLGYNRRCIGEGEELCKRRKRCSSFSEFRIGKQ